MRGIGSRIAGRVHRSIPKRHEMEQNRFFRPFAVRAELWRFTRRSVPRGVAIGLMAGIFIWWIPPLKILGAALICLPFRANIPMAAAMTLLSNPLTATPLYAGAIYIANQLGFDADLSMFYALYEHGASLGEWGAWLVSDVAPALLIGLLVIATIAGLLGYLVSSFLWRWWIARKRRTRLRRTGAWPETPE